MQKTSLKSDSRPDKLLDLDISNVEPDPEQVRKHFDLDSLGELTNSIKALGVLQPILVREGEKGKFIIVAGERRYRAAKEAGLTRIPAILTGGNPQEISLVENILRENLTAIEEAEAAQAMIEKHNYKQEDLAKILGKKGSTVSDILSLNKLPQEIRDDARQNPKVSRRALLEILRAKKRDKARVALYNKLKSQGLTSEEVKKQKRGGKGSREISARDVAYQIRSLTHTIESLKTEKWTDEEREKVLEAIRGLKGVIEESHVKLAA